MSFDRAARAGTPVPALRQASLDQRALAPWHLTSGSYAARRPTCTPWPPRTACASTSTLNELLERPPWLATAALQEEVPAYQLGM